MTGDRAATERAIEEKVVEELDRIGLPYELIECDPEFADTGAFCARYGFAPDESANTIVVVGKSDPRRYAVCVVLATTRLDVNRTVKQLLGVRKASFASADETMDLTAMAIGGVTALALPAHLPLYVDSRVMERDSVILGGGSRHMKVKVSPDALTRLPNSEVVAELAKEIEP